MFSKDHREKYYCSYCDMFVGSKDTTKSHERNVHNANDSVVECRCPVCK